MWWRDIARSGLCPHMCVPDQVHNTVTCCEPTPVLQVRMPTQVAGGEEPARPADAAELKGRQEGPEPMEALEDVVLQNSSQFHR